jgi:hypothetical protein
MELKAMEALVAAAVLAPVVGAVTAYNAWALYRACKDRFFAAGGRPRRIAAPAHIVEHC